MKLSQSRSTLGLAFGCLVVTVDAGHEVFAQICRPASGLE
jgi:hypothetical protein